MIGDISDAMLDGDQCQFCGAAMEGGDGNPQTCASCRHETRRAPKPVPKSDRGSEPTSRLYVLTHEITELEDYEKVPSDGTQIEVVCESEGRVARLEAGLRKIIAKYNGFTSAKEIMEIARETLEPHSCPRCSTSA